METDAKILGTADNYPNRKGNLVETESTRKRIVLILAGITMVCLSSVGARGQSAPTITAQPTNQTVVIGATVVFTVAASGSGPLSYQWQFNGVDLPTGIITTVAGKGPESVPGTGSPRPAGDGGTATKAVLSGPNDVAFDAWGNYYISEYESLRKVDTNGIITTVAGNGNYGYSGDGGPATNAELSGSTGVALDASGNLYFSDFGNNVIRKVSTNGVITSVVGNGREGYSGDDGPATNAELHSPSGLVFDASGSLYFSDSGNNVIRKVSVNGIITTVAGNGSKGYSGDNVAATNASLDFPEGIALDASGNLFIADPGNARIRRVGTDGTISSVAGNGMQGYSQDNIAATDAELNNATGVAVDTFGNIFIADYGNSRVRRVDPTGTITTAAGDGRGGFSGDGGYAVNASLYYPGGVSVDASNNLFVADSDNNRIRKVKFVDRPTLTLTGVTSAELGNYSVVINNAYGSVTSAVVTLKVAAPVRVPSGFSIAVSATYADQESPSGPLDTGSATISLTLPLSDVDTSTLSATTPFAIRVGDFNYSDAIGDDPNWTPGKTKATVVDPVDGDTMTVSWTSNSVMMKYHASFDAFNARYAYGNDGGSYPFSDFLHLTIHFAGYSSPPYDLLLAGKNIETLIGDPDTGFALESGSFTASGNFTGPNISINRPNNNAKSQPDGTITIAGTVADKVGVNDVFMQLNGGTPFWVPFEASNPNALFITSATWSTTLDPSDFPDEVSGSNLVTVWAEDIYTNSSETDSVSFVYEAPETVSLSTNGEGSVVGIVDGEQLLAGASYPVGAIPAVGWIFAGWTDENGAILSLNSKYAFVMRAGARLIANFLPSPFPVRSATFIGLFSANIGPTPASVGYGVFTLTHSGAWTGRILIGPSTFSMSGAFQGNEITGDVLCSIVLGPKTAPLVVQFTLQASAAPTNLRIALTSYADETRMETNWSASGQMVLCGPASPIPTAGRYNIALPGLPAYVDQATGLVVSNGPYGYGYANATLGAKGNVTIAAILPDGSPAISFATLQTFDGRFPFYAPLYKGKGVIAGWFTFTNDTAAKLDVESSDLVWIALPGCLVAYPNGFSSEATPFTHIAGGDLYTAPAKGQNLFGSDTLEFMFNLTDPAQSLAFNPLRNTFNLPAPEEASFVPATGIVSGAIHCHGSSKLEKFGGIYLPRLGMGYGFLNNGLPFTFSPAASPQ